MGFKKNTYPQDYEKWVICHFKEDLKIKTPLGFTCVRFEDYSNKLSSRIYGWCLETSLQAGS